MGASAKVTWLLLAWAFPSWAQAPVAEPPANLYRAALHTFSVARSGVAVDDPTTGVHHPASHMQDAVLAGTTEHRDLTGGWYNAGDYGKWPMMAAISVSYMLDLYGLQARAASVSGRQNQQPDPALLEEARWGLSWMLRMQDADGGVRQKVDGVTVASLSAAWGKSPELDPNLRVAAPASTGSTADFAAAMYQASAFYAANDPDEARRFRAAADRAWAWLPGTRTSQRTIRSISTTMPRASCCGRGVRMPLRTGKSRQTSPGRLQLASSRRSAGSTHRCLDCIAWRPRRGLRIDFARRPAP